MSEFEDNEVVKVKKVVKKVPTRTWAFAGVSFVALLFSILFQRIVTLAPQGSKVSTLFIYQSLSTTLSWVFIVSGAAAVFTGLTYVHNKELASRLANIRRNVTTSNVAPVKSNVSQEVRQEENI